MRTAPLSGAKHCICVNAERLGSAMYFVNHAWEAVGTLPKTGERQQACSRRRDLQSCAGRQKPLYLLWRRCVVRLPLRHRRVRAQGYLRENGSMTLASSRSRSREYYTQPELSRPTTCDGPNYSAHQSIHYFIYSPNLLSLCALCYRALCGLPLLVTNELVDHKRELEEDCRAAEIVTGLEAFALPIAAQFTFSQSQPTVANAAYDAEIHQSPRLRAALTGLVAWTWGGSTDVYVGGVGPNGRRQARRIQAAAPCRATRERSAACTGARRARSAVPAGLRGSGGAQAPIQRGGARACPGVAACHRTYHEDVEQILGVRKEIFRPGNT
ncbi:hypothetical protein PybrP1_006035 [[Pythium] brassicae (nom. inval.)]|nr:hypothetical protein PybrP1_006035 [[Pythium] brassicae (nom. inval.)]